MDSAVRALFFSSRTTDDHNFYGGSCVGSWFFVEVAFLSLQLVRAMGELALWQCSVRLCLFRKCLFFLLLLNRDNGK